MSPRIPLRRSKSPPNSFFQNPPLLKTLRCYDPQWSNTCGLWWDDESQQALVLVHEDLDWQNNWVSSSSITAEYRLPNHSTNSFLPCSMVTACLMSAADIGSAAREACAATKICEERLLTSFCAVYESLNAVLRALCATANSDLKALPNRGDSRTHLGFRLQQYRCFCEVGYSIF